LLLLLLPLALVLALRHSFLLPSPLFPLHPISPSFTLSSLLPPLSPLRSELACTRSGCLPLFALVWAVPSFALVWVVLSFTLVWTACRCLCSCLRTSALPLAVPLVCAL
jgi:hypothetical protein